MQGFVKRVFPVRTGVKKNGEQYQSMEFVFAFNPRVSQSNGQTYYDEMVVSAQTPELMAIINQVAGTSKMIDCTVDYWVNENADGTRAYNNIKLFRATPVGVPQMPMAQGQTQVAPQVQQFAQQVGAQVMPPQNSGLPF